MEGYKATVTKSSKELNAREKLKVLAFADAVQINEVTVNSELVIPYAYHAICEVHNEKSDKKDYIKMVVVDRDGNTYVTGSESFRTSLEEILEVLADAGDESEFDIKVCQKASKNFKGGNFLTCYLI